MEHIKRNPYQKQVAEPWAIFVENFNVYQMIIYLTQKFPLKLQEKYAEATSNPKMKEEAIKLAGLSDKIVNLQHTLNHFMNH